MVRDLLDSLHGQGFRRFLLLNGHGGNEPVAGLAHEWMAANPDGQVRFHSWWNGPRTWAVVQRIDPRGDARVVARELPVDAAARRRGAAQGKPMIDPVHLRILDPAGVRALLEDGSYGGRYQRSDEEMLEVWAAGVTEVRDLLANGWR